MAWRKVKRSNSRGRRDPENAEATRDDRKSLGESLSALSNAVGGVLIFGIEDKKGESDIDRADKPQPLNDAVSFASKIKSIVPEILSPPHGGIKVMAILQAEGSNSGVVAIQVPESKFRPHMSMAPGHQKYFQRAGASNRVMVDFQVRDMIRVQRSPRLSLGYILRPGGIAGSSDGAEHLSSLFLTLGNDGTVSAKQAYLLVRPETSLIPVHGASMQFDAIDAASNCKIGVQAGSGFAIHPSVEIAVVRFIFHVKMKQNEVFIRFNEGGELVRWRDLPPVTVKAAFGCENVPLTEAEFMLKRSEMEQMAKWVINSRQPFQSKHRYGESDTTG
ncbi:Putative DNA-binding domain-containing protein [Hyphomicrobium facile]|uniref:Putative DNA-binding domain-containing protein n=2 Tax=Hyphomicrobium facile TaxID=51670 RepID=A0A1I7NE43_9HYPH|nr:ATP-binding protein [Hyphomicrobium facile]SFV32947.1 Putative DNA-binding domain-containing protein [Hyphomicrobium facile]